jgi:hypothetical protein
MLTMLTILYIPFDESLQIYLHEIEWVTTVGKIYHFDFLKEEIFIGGNYKYFI